MPSAAINTIITGFGVMTLNSTATDSFQDDVIFELARGMYKDVLAQVGASFTAVVGGTARYALPASSGARTPLAIFYGETQLLQLRKDEAQAYDEAWRNAPLFHVVGFLFDPEDRTSYSLVPPPREDGGTIGGNTPTAVAAWPRGNITVIYAATDLTFPGTTYADAQLPVALEVLAREFGRDSDHQDLMMSDVCRNLAKFFFLMFNPVGRPV